MANEEKFLFESLQDTKTIQNFLEALVDGFSRERIVLTTNRDEIALVPSGLLNVSIKARKKEGGSKLSIKISWKDSDLDKSPGGREISVSS
ncbi:MAG: amphi-Trp domain-containing protein [Desulfovibrionales bacterium]